MILLIPISTSLWRSGLILAMLLFPLAAHAYDLKTRDGLSLGFDKQARVVRLKVGDAALPLRSPGGFYVADVKDIPAREVEDPDSIGDELLANPSFERLQDGKPLGWSVGSDWSVDRQVAHSGKASMRVSLAGPQKGNSGNLSIELQVKPNTPYRVSAWMRTDGGAPYLYIVQMDAQGKTRPDYPQICISHARYHSDWFQLSHSFVTAPFCRKIQVYTNLWQQTGTAWVDDVSVVSLEDDYLTSQRLVTGAVKQTGNGVRQIAELKDQSLRLSATCKATQDYIAVEGEVIDTATRDRAITLSFRLPFEAQGWTWYDDIHNRQIIEDGVRYGAARLLGERRMISLYPFAAIGNGKTALAIAVPMDMPRVFRLCYDRRLGYFLNYEFGLSQQASKFPGRATFRFVIYRIDPRWGFRSAAQRYYELFPQFFTKRVEREGGAGFMVDASAIESPDFSVPAFSIFDYWKNQSLDAHRRELVKLFSYTEFAGWWGWALGIKPEQAKKQPTREEAWAHVEQLAHRDPPDKVAQCIVNCAPYDREGKPRLHENYVADWGGYNYICNPDPEIEGIGGKVNRYTLTCEREVSQVDAFKLDGMYYDCAFVFAVDNFRREHFKWADNPLAFDHLSKKPVIPMVFSIYECSKAIADDMHRRGKLVMSNYSVTDLPTEMFCIQFIDVIGNEMLWTWTTDAKFALQRTLAYQKTVSMSWQEAKKDWPAETIERELKQAMFYGTFYYLSNLSPELYERWVPLTMRLAKAGWEPITHARCDSPVMVERFGASARRNLHFTLRNETGEPKPIELTLDAQDLGLNAAPALDFWLARDSWTFEEMDVKRGGRQWMVKLIVPPNDTLVLRVATKRSLVLDHLFSVPDLLRKAANYRDALKGAGVELMCPDYEAALKQLAQLIPSLGSSQPEMNFDLKTLADNLREPVVKGDAGKHQAWVTRLKDYTAQAQARVRAASALSQTGRNQQR